MARPGYPTNAGTFTLRGTIFQQTDPIAANALLNQSVALGENLAPRARRLNTLLHNVPGMTSQTSGAKGHTAFQTAATKPNTAQDARHWWRM